MIVQC